MIYVSLVSREIYGS
ncbi:hypothetical protein F383_39239 [Gossypium arboreum]|uniref:Uncharacterized protein n=1 Tax=Gossypium arboreum TaxID=29729 RepID=A0A0B0MR34_GOSAR|nr:hypothetical protein F383_39239 [Gossypium arboreum]